MLMDVLLIATGFSGALTLVWLGRALARLVRPPAGAVVHFAPGAAPVDALLRELGTAKREVLLMAGGLACRPVAQALVDARLRHVQVEVLLDAAAENDPASDLHFLVEQGLVPLLASQPSGLRGLVAVIDGKMVACGSADLAGAEVPAGQVLLVRGHADLVASCRQQFATLRGPARAIGGMAAQPQEVRTTSAEPASPATAPPQPTEHVEPPAEDVLASIARGLTSEIEPAAAADEEEAHSDSEAQPAAGPTVTRATAELFARLRREAAVAEQDDSTENAA
jgi:hypothetical protein